MTVSHTVARGSSRVATRDAEARRASSVCVPAGPRKLRAAARPQAAWETPPPDSAASIAWFGFSPGEKPYSPWPSCTCLA